jgi:uncharacterized protein YigE (DUF2233 family)|tara:strand:- start:9670 stop:10368 length:699 start_codon:yes stop_codon:yes gene_type:complete
MKTITLSILTILIAFLTPYSTEMEVVFKNKGVTISTNSSFEVLEFNPTNFKFGVSEGKPTNTDFYINGNFFFKGGAPMGLVVIDGKKKSGKRKGGGFFYVKNGKPYVRSKYCPSYTEYCSQSVFWGIDNGEVNTFALTENHSKQKRFRTLIGENKNGGIILIISKIRLDVKTILDFSMEYNLVDAVFCDGGSSVDYYFNNGKYSSTFKSMNNNIKTILDIDQPPIYISGNFK